MSDVTSVTPEEFMTIGNLTGVADFTAKVKNGLLSVYFSAKVKNATAGAMTLFTVKERYRPSLGYKIAPVRKNGSPYEEIATLWVSTSGSATSYGTIAAGTHIWVQMEYAI